MTALELIEAGKTWRAIQAKYPGIERLSRHERAKFLLSRTDFGSVPSNDGSQKKDRARASGSDLSKASNRAPTGKSTRSPAIELKALGLFRPSTKRKSKWTMLRGIPKRPPNPRPQPVPAPDPMERLRASIYRTVGLTAQRSLFAKSGDIAEEYRVQPEDLVTEIRRGGRTLHRTPDGAMFPDWLSAVNHCEATMNLAARPPKKLS